MVTTFNKNQIHENFLSILSGLTEKEQAVITRRIGLA